MPAIRRRRQRRMSTRSSTHGDATRGHSRSPSLPSNDTEHGEGNYKAAREFDEAERTFVESGKVEAAEGNAAPKSEAERRELNAAEQQARQRAKEEDPQLYKRK
jgi:hypothetical protein